MRLVKYGCKELSPYHKLPCEGKRNHKGRHINKYEMWGSMRYVGEIMAKTKWEVFVALWNEFHNALPEIAHECDVDVFEAHADKRGNKKYDRFREKVNEPFKDN